MSTFLQDPSAATLAPPLPVRWHTAITILLLVATPLFFWGGPGYRSSQSFKSFWDLGHVGYFLLFSLWAHTQWRKQTEPKSQLAVFLSIFLAVLILGALVELLQMFVDGRTPDIFDVVRDLAGCLAAFAFIIRPRVFAKPGANRLFVTLVCLVLTWCIWPLPRAMTDEYLARQQFPLLADFETPFELDHWTNRWRFEQASEPVRHGAHSMRLHLDTSQFSGIALFYFPHDWRGYRTLHFSVYNPDPTPLVLHGRIHDRWHQEHKLEMQDRFNTQFTLLSGWNDLEISLDAVEHAPKSRPMDMAHIEEFGLFVMQEPAPRTVYLDYVHLAK